MRNGGCEEAMFRSSFAAKLQGLWPMTATAAAMTEPRGSRLKKSNPTPAYRAQWRSGRIPIANHDIIWI
jgi:hypothetical protein